MFGKGTAFTDDTIMTVAVAEALMNVRERKRLNEDILKVVDRFYETVRVS